MPKIDGTDTLTGVKDHIYDDYRNLGYDYRRNILRHMLTPEMFANPLNDTPMRQIERMVENLLDAVRKIKLHYALTFDKNSKLIN